MDPSGSGAFCGWIPRDTIASRNSLRDTAQALCQTREPVGAQTRPATIGKLSTELSSIDWFPLWLSLRVAALSTALAIVIGLWIAYVLANRSFRGKELLDAAVTLPLVLPPTVLGYYLLVLVGRTSVIGTVYESIFGAPIVFTWQAAVIAAWIHSAPLLIKSARAAFESVDPSYERAARTLGASELRLFWRVTLPLSGARLRRRRRLRSQGH